jgi:hypothetical protein
MGCDVGRIEGYTMSSNQAGKGDAPRPVKWESWDATWERLKASKAANSADKPLTPCKPPESRGTSPHGHRPQA